MPLDDKYSKALNTIIHKALNTCAFAQVATKTNCTRIIFADDAAMEAGQNEEILMEKKKKSRFKTVQIEEKNDTMGQRKAPSTNQATKLWVKCLRQYLSEKKLPALEDMETKDLPDMLENFYIELRKADCQGEYKTSTLKCIRAALNRYFKEERSLDILNDQRFIRCNEMFTGVTRKAKLEGRGETESMPPIEPEDLQLISEYFQRNMDGPANPQKLQEIVLFNIIYYMGRCRRQNLQPMTKATLQLAQDPDGKTYIYQAKKELDKNHKENDLRPNNQARIYEIPGQLNQKITMYSNTEKAHKNMRNFALHKSSLQSH